MPNYKRYSFVIINRQGQLVSAYLFRTRDAAKAHIRACSHMIGCRAWPIEVW